MREPGEVSEEVNGLLLGLNTEAVSKYIVTDRLVPLFQPKGDLTKCPKTLSLFLDSKESPEKRFWNEYGFSKIRINSFWRHLQEQMLLHSSSTLNPQRLQL